MMRLAAVLGVAAAMPAFADEATMREGLLACFTGLPTFASVEATLTANGWSSVRGAMPNERELGRGGVGVAVASGGVEAQPGCSVSTGDVPVARAEQLLVAELDRGFAGRWTTAPGYGGSKMWMVPGQGASLVMYVLGGGNSGDGPGSGISLSIRRDN